MQPAEREILSLIGSVSSIVHVLVALAVVVLGLVAVRPLNKVAGFAYTCGGVCRVIGIALSALLRSMQPAHADVNAALAISSISTVIWLVTSVLFFGGVLFGSIKLADTHAPPQRGAW